MNVFYPKVLHRRTPHRTPMLFGKGNKLLGALLTVFCMAFLCHLPGQAQDRIHFETNCNVREIFTAGQCNNNTDVTISTLTTSGLPNTISSTTIELKKVHVSINHRWAQFDQVKLKSPQGDVVLLTDNSQNGLVNGWLGLRNGDCVEGVDMVTYSVDDAPNANYKTTFPNQSVYMGYYVPQDNNFNAFNNTDPNGDWELTICSEQPATFWRTGVEFNYFGLTFYEPPTCTNPDDLEITGTLDTKVFFEYTSANSGSGYTIEVGPYGFEPGTGAFDEQFTGTVPGNNVRLELDGLNPDQCYQLYIEEDCGSNWVGPIAFCTDCSPIDPTQEHGYYTTLNSNHSTPGYWTAFENGGNIPDCWRNGSSTGEEWLFSTFSSWGPNPDHTPAPGIYYAWVDDLNTNTTDVTLTSPLFEADSLDPEPYLSFWEYSGKWANYNGDLARLQVDVFDGQNWRENIYSNDEEITEWTLREMPIDTITFTGPMKFRFVVDHSPSTTWNDRAIDDVILREAPNCPNPTNLQTLNVLHNTATLEWVTQNPGTTYRIYYGINGNLTDTITGDIPVSHVAGTPFKVQLTGLSGLTSYCWELEELCGSHRVGEYGAACFETRCDPVLAPLITQGGDLNSAGPGLYDAPTCFLNYQVDPSGGNQNIRWAFRTQSQWSNFGWGPASAAGGSGIYAEMTGDADAEDSNLETRLIDISNLTTPILTFKVNSYGINGLAGQFDVDVFDGEEWQEDAFTYNFGDNRINGTIEQWQPFEVNMIRYNLDPAKPVMARFAADPATANSIQVNLGIDDLNIGEAGPCGTPFDLQVIGISLDQAVVSYQFTPPISFLGYEVRYKESSATDWVDTIATSRDVAVIFGLDEGTQYDWEVRADCDGRGYGDWSSTSTFTTYRVGAICEYPTEVNNLPYVRTNQSTDGFGNYYDDLDGCVSPYLLGEEHVFEYTSPKDQVVSVELTNTSNSVGVFVLDACPDDLTVGCVASAESPSGNPKISQARLEANQTYYIVVSTNPSPSSTDFDIEIREIPCPDPVDIEVSDVTNTEADFSWIPLSITQDTWEVWVSTSSATPTPGTGTIVNNTPSFSETGLTPNTEYHFFIQEECNNGNKSTIIGPISFWTLRNPIDNNPMACQNIALQDDNCDNRNIIPIQENNTNDNLGVVQLEAVKLIVEHADVEELDISLISPNGVEVDLVRGEDVDGANFGNPNNCPNEFTEFSIRSSAMISGGSAPYISTYMPKQPFIDFNDGTAANGLWKLKICDTQAGNSGTFVYAALEFTQLPKLTISDATVAENAGPLTFNLSLPSARNYPVSVDYMIVDSTTNAGLDYTASSVQTITFNPGQTSRTITVNVIDDALNELDEILKVELTNPVNVRLTDDVAIGIITNDDPEPQLSVSDITVDESAGSMRFALNLSELSGRDITFDYQTEDIEAVGTPFGGAGDYVEVLDGSFTIPQGEQGYIEIVVIDDLSDEFEENMRIVISNASGATISDAEAIGKIIDDDNPPYLIVEEAAADEGNVPGDNAQMIFTASLTQPSDKPISFDFSTLDNTAIAGEDYEAVSGQTVSFTPGSNTTTFTVNLVEDLDAEDYETFNVLLFNSQNVTIPAGGPIVGTIVNDDRAPLAVTVNYEVDEDQILIVDAANGVIQNAVEGTGGAILSAEVVETTLNGTLTFNENDGSFTYVPAPNFFGEDRFVYNVSDAANTSINGVVRISVNPVSDAPIITGIMDDTVCSGDVVVLNLVDYTTDIDDIVSEYEFTFGANIVDIQGDISANEIMLQVDPFRNEATVRPMTANSGVVTIEFTATDVSGQTASDVMDLRVNARPKLSLDILNACENSEFDVNAVIDLDFGSVDSIRWEVNMDDSVDYVSNGFTFDQSRVGTYPVTAEVFVSSGCNATFTENIQVYPFPDAKIYQVGNQLTASNGEEYQWYLNGVAIAEEDGGKNQILFAREKGDYTVDVTNEGGCKTTSAVLILTVSGTDDPAEYGVSLYPSVNVSDFVTLEMNNVVMGAMEITITTVDGKEVHTEAVLKATQSLEHQLDVRALPSGSYMVKVSSDEFTTVRRFIK